MYKEQILNFTRRICRLAAALIHLTYKRAIVILNRQVIYHSKDTALHKKHSQMSQWLWIEQSCYVNALLAHSKVQGSCEYPNEP